MWQWLGFSLMSTPVCWRLGNADCVALEEEEAEVGELVVDFTVRLNAEDCLVD